MEVGNVDIEIEKLKGKITELRNKMKYTRDSFDKEDLKVKISNIDQQIQMLERMKMKS